MKKTLTITGMSCEHCVRRVTEALRATAGVAGAKVALKDGRAEVEGEGLDDAAIKAAVEDAGYAVSKIE